MIRSTKANGKETAMFFQEFTDTNRSFEHDFDIEEESFIAVLTQMKSGEQNMITPFNFYDVYLFRSQTFTYMWAMRSFSDFIRLLKFGSDGVAMKNIPIHPWLTHILYHTSLPHMNRDEFIRRMKQHEFILNPMP